jgi:hypothetical protein
MISLPIKRFRGYCLRSLVKHAYVDLHNPADGEHIYALDSRLAQRASR